MIVTAPWRHGQLWARCVLTTLHRCPGDREGNRARADHCGHGGSAATERMRWRRFKIQHVCTASQLRESSSYADHLVHFAGPCRYYNQSEALPHRNHE